MEIYKSKGRIKVKNWERLGESERRSERIPKLLIYTEGMKDTFLIHNTKLVEMIEGLEISIIQRATGSLNLLKDNFTS